LDVGKKSEIKETSYKDLFFEMRDALVVLLSFYKDIHEITLSFIAERKEFVKFAKGYEMKFVYEVYEKIKGLK